MPDKKDTYIVTIDGDEHELNLAFDGSGYILHYNGNSHHIVVDRLSNSKYLYKIDSASSEVDITGTSEKLDIFLEGKLMNVRVEPKELLVAAHRGRKAPTAPERSRDRRTFMAPTRST